MIKLSLKIVVFIIDPTSKSRHAMDLISRSFKAKARADGILHLGCSSLNHSEVPSSGNELGIAVGNSEPQINPRTRTEKLNQSFELGVSFNW